MCVWGGGGGGGGISVYDKGDRTVSVHSCRNLFPDFTIVKIE